MSPASTAEPVQLASSFIGQEARRVQGCCEHAGHVTIVRGQPAAGAIGLETVRRSGMALPTPQILGTGECTMVLGLGTDLIEIARIAASIERFGDRFLRRVFTPDEIAYCRRKRNAAESFAARFAAKEAGAKALGTGISYGVSWPEIEVRREPSGRPTLHWSGRAQELAAQLGVRRSSVSLTHSRELAMAFVVVED